MESIINEQRYKREQEDFVSNHGGSTSQEILLALLPNICGILLTATIIGLLKKKPDRIIQTCIEFVLNVFPCVLCFTILSNYTITVSIIMIVMSIINFLIILDRSKNHNMNHDNNVNSKNNNNLIKRPFITNYRALTNIITSICILAVDFQIFPRKYAKTEIYGYSLMDTGVGFFIISNALVSQESRAYNNERPKWSIFKKFSENTKNCTKNSAFLLLLGFGRFIAVEFSGYQRHITEYGIHWNFFITLAFVKIFTSTISSAISTKYSLLSGIWIIGMHEYALSTKGIKEWILGDSPRNDFISANREGILSIPGYVGIYFIGIAIGKLIYTTYNTNNCHYDKTKNYYKSKKQQLSIILFGKNINIHYNKSMILCIKLSLISVQSCAVTLFCDFNFGVSRRLANSGYCSWIITLSTAVLTLLLLIEIMTDVINVICAKNSINQSAAAAAAARGLNKKDYKSKIKYMEKNVIDDDNPLIYQCPEIFEAVNYNGLAFFLISNLLTGVINMSTKTLYVGTWQSIQILVLYIAVVIFFSICLYRCHIQLKL
ncbi:GPI-anchored wall transfer protein 1-like [Aphidius gifuensis]|uniref:GPI-anchored wall transfer protein 1-like n=1 Tax=Aphidius gifuensis TaxID=684658 RepID=UPI001CDB9C9C|nr:GPI-anchored wall transfer protein 1-like [Aphidius gifuensis]